MIVEGPLDCLDHSSKIADYGTKIGIDATKKIDGENHNREWPDRLKMDSEIEKKAEMILKKGRFE